MSTLDLRATPLDLFGTVGDDVILAVTCLTTEGAPVDMSTYTIQADVLRGGAVAETFTDSVGGAGNSVITLSLTEAQTASIGNDRGLTWSLSTTIAGETRQWCAGEFRLVTAGNPKPSGARGRATVIIDGSIQATLSEVAGGIEGKVNRAGDTMTGDLAIQGATARLYLSDTDEAVDLKQHQIQSSGGDLFLSSASDAGSIQRIFMRLRRALGQVDMLAATSVAVPPPTADTHAATKLYADGKVAKTGDTMTGDLTISKAIANLRLYDSAGTVDQRHARIQMSGTNLAVQHLTDASGFVRNMLLLRLNTGQVDATGAASVAVPAATAATHAAQVSAIDATTGRLAIGGKEIGDTGWRNVSSLLATGWTATRASLRRTGNTVQVDVNGLTYSSGGTSTAMILPTGFRSYFTGGTLFPYTDQPGAAAAATVTGQGDVSSSGAVLVSTLETAGVSASFTFTTTNAWPTTLPGVAA